MCINETDLIDNEIKSIEKKLHGGRNMGKTYNRGVIEGLTIASAILSTHKKKVEKQIDIAKYFFKSILDVDPNLNNGNISHLVNCINVMKISAEKALAEIGGDDE